MSVEDSGPGERTAPPAAATAVPVLRDVIRPAGTTGPVTRGLGRDARAALDAEAAFLIDEVLDEFLPELEARLRERLEQRLREWLEQAP
jgi:hypothetical protein